MCTYIAKRISKIKIRMNSILLIVLFSLQFGLDSIFNISRAGQDDVLLREFEVMAYLPYWGYLDDAEGNPGYTKYHYSDISTVFILATIRKQSVLENKGLIYGESAHDISNQVDFESMVAYMRDEAPNLKILLSLSDLHNNSTERAESAELVSDLNRRKTIHWLMENYVDKYDLDGIDIDFEDASLDSDYMGVNYSKFIKELSRAMHNRSARGRKKLATATLAGGDYSRSTITNDFVSSIDLLGVQTYSADKMDYLRYNENRDMKRDFENWTSRGVPANKLAFGLSMWSKVADPSKRHGLQLPTAGTSNGRSWISQLKQESNDDYRAYLTSSFNTPGFPAAFEQRYSGLYEIRRRAEWVKSVSARGVFCWELSKDPARKDVQQRPYSLLRKLMDWKRNPDDYLPIVAYTKNDYYGWGSSIAGGFHSLTADEYNWIGIYEFDTTEPYNIGASTGFYQYLPNTSSGEYTLPVSVANALESNKMYILRISNGAGGIGESVLGTSHPFYRL
ncbi:glycoside hydrolase family 18 protein [uncultured Microbulbifer sp.]|uniref:glycoside hydrolase family 18 protein n=1 Tax=uncultured Microbulbifer sp. TaxID=348147 RepID=UPI00262B1616|nr:glycoside hydrolase family 18 protein [uncultured Microbulbifer sp.]